MSNDTTGSTISVSLPALLFYVPYFREYISDTLKRVGFSERFAYRTEIIVDELCTNAIRYGSRDRSSRIEIKLTWYSDHIDLSITDEGGDKENISNLRGIIATPPPKGEILKHDTDSLGLEIVRMLSKKIDVSISDQNITTVRIVRSMEAE